MNISYDPAFQPKRVKEKRQILLHYTTKLKSYFRAFSRVDVHGLDTDRNNARTDTRHAMFVNAFTEHTKNEPQDSRRERRAFARTQAKIEWRNRATV